MESVPFDRFLQALADRDVYPDSAHIQDGDVEAIWAEVPDDTRLDYLRELGLPTDLVGDVEVELDAGEVLFETPQDDGPDPEEAPDGIEAAEALASLAPGELEEPPVPEAEADEPDEQPDPADPEEAYPDEAHPEDAEPTLVDEDDPDLADVEAIPVEEEPAPGDDGPVEPDVTDLEDLSAEEVVAEGTGMDQDEAMDVPVESIAEDGISEAEARAIGDLEELTDEDTVEHVPEEPGEDSRQEIEVYPVYEPYAYVRITYDEDDHQYLYEVIEPELSDREEKVLDFIQETIVDVIDVGLSRLTEEEAEEMLVDLTDQVITDYSIELDEKARRRLTYYIVRDFLGYGKLDVIMRDPMIEDISCDGVGIPIFLYHRKYESVASTVIFDTDSELDSYVIKLAQRSGKHISIADPLLDARLPDGSRLNATLAREVTTSGSTFTIRKFRDEPFTPPDLIRFGTMSPRMLGYFWLAIQHGASMIIAGGTASGKTTALNATLLFIPPQMKIVSIEDTRELNLPHPNWIPGTTRSGFGARDEKGRQAGEIDMFQLLKAALRQRPEYITVGEVRGEEATVLFQAMATGHAAYGTMHADSVTSVIHRLEGEPINIPRPLLEALDIVTIQIQTRIGGQRVRRTKEIIEIVGMDPNTKELLTNEVFSWDPADDTFEHSGISYVLERIQRENNMTDAELSAEVENRTLIIEWMRDKDVRDYVDVAKVVQAYYNEPEKTMRRIRIDLGLVDDVDGEALALEELLEEDEPAGPAGADAQMEDHGDQPELPDMEEMEDLAELSPLTEDQLDDVTPMEEVEPSPEELVEEEPHEIDDEGPPEGPVDEAETAEPEAPGPQPLDEPDGFDPEPAEPEPLDAPETAEPDALDEPERLDEDEPVEPETAEYEPLDEPETAEHEPLGEPDTAGPEPVEPDALDDLEAFAAEADDELSEPEPEEAPEDAEEAQGPPDVNDLDVLEEMAAETEELDEDDKDDEDEEERT